MVGEVVGTAPYTAPEQIRGEAVDARTDLFSFGILIYEPAARRCWQRGDVDHYFSLRERLEALLVQMGVR